jgi:hypothetical protein
MRALPSERKIPCECALVMVNGMTTIRFFRMMALRPTASSTIKHVE